MCGFLGRALRALQSARERGSASLELAVLALPVLAIFGLMIGAGRVALAGNTINSAAGEAARAASIQRTQADAVAAGTEIANQIIQSNNLPCQPTVNIDATEFGKPVGETATVRVDVSCTVTLSDLAVPGMPGSVTLDGTGESIIDTWRGRE